VNLLSFKKPNIPASLKYSKVPLNRILEDSAQEFPNRYAVIFEDFSITYSDLNSLANRFANSLKDYLHVNKGDRVAVFLPNQSQFIIAFYGIIKTGAIAVLLDAMSKEQELYHFLKDSGAETIITSEHLCPIVNQVQRDLKLKTVIVCKPNDSVSVFTSINKSEMNYILKNGNVSLLELILASEPHHPEVNIDSKDIATIMYTGGTTGSPKGVMHTHYNHIVTVTQQSTWWGLGKGCETGGLFIPVTHVGGLCCSLNMLIHIAGTIVLMQRFDPSQFLKLIQEHGIGFVCAVPTVYLALASHPDVEKYDLSTLKVCLSGGAHLPFEVWSLFKSKIGVGITNGFGMTESSSQITLCPPGFFKKELIGLPIPDTQVKIVDPENGDKILGVREEGEIVAKGPQFMKGYWENPEETDATVRGGWLFTGDLGLFDENGLFYHIGRKKELINTGGLKVWPNEVEGVLYDNQAVKEAIVIGVTDKYWGEKVKAFVVLEPEYNVKVSENDIIQYCKTKLSRFKAPKEVEFREKIPKTPLGKPLRRVLVEEEKEKELNLKSQKQQ